MTKILLQSDRIIFDGHADTIQECETITLLCDSLANSQNFKTVRYESGYAEFKKSDVVKLADSELRFIPAMGHITMIFDSHISAVNSRSPMTLNWTSSGETQDSAAIDGTTYTFDVILTSGYVIDTVVLSDTEESLGKLTGTTDTTFSILAGMGGITQTITITSKQATVSKSYDLSTSSKWSALSDGEHTVQIVAKGTGYRDSAKSTSVTVTKGGSTGETWVLNDHLGTNELSFTSVNFTSNQIAFDGISRTRTGYDDVLAYRGVDKVINTIECYIDSSWVDEAYRTITFETAPTGDLLTWLQANGVKQ